MTKLEKLAFFNPKYLALGENADKKDRQRVLDEITDEVVGQLSPDEISEHVKAIYDATVNEYAANPHTRDIIDELVVFMNILPDHPAVAVLDVGCGVGRDTLFMSVPDHNFRKGLMNRVRDGCATHEKYAVPTKRLLVYAIDSSDEMLKLAELQKGKLLEQGLLNSGLPHLPIFLKEDMHCFIDELLCDFEGVWSCTALFTHTPRELVSKAMRSVSKSLKLGGIFFTSYTNGLADGRYNKLLLSSTGFIKYFSQPDPGEITEIARQHSLTLESESFSDFEMNGKVIKKNLFVSQFFRKA